MIVKVVPTSGALSTSTAPPWASAQARTNARPSPQLSPAQFSLLQLLVAHAGRLCTRDAIVAAVWPNAAGGVSEDAVDGLIKRVRARLSEVAQGDRYLQNVRGRGLILRGAAKAP